MRYVDTSLLVAALLNGKGTAVAQRWLRAQSVGELGISDRVITEFSTALSMKLRTGELEPPLADQHATGLRAAGALHLAIASHHGDSLHTLDKRLVEIGQVLGVDTALVGG